MQVLLFSTMTRVLDVLEDYLDWRGFEHLRLDGAVSSADRGDLVHKFNEPGDTLPPLVTCAPFCNACNGLHPDSV